MDERSEPNRETDETMPVVVIDNDPVEEPVLNEDPRPRRRLLWPAVGGVLLLAILAGAAVIRQHTPTSRPMIPAVEIAHVDAAPLAPEPVAIPEDQIVEETPQIAVPALPTTEAVLVKKEVKEVPAVPEVRPEPTAPPPAETVAKGAPLPAVPEPVEATFEKQLLFAAVQIREAEPLFQEVADSFDPVVLKKTSLRELADKMDRVELKLKEAQHIYTRLQTDAPEMVNLEWRLQALHELLDALQQGRARIRVPLALQDARALQKEAEPLAKEALEGFQPFSREAQALDAKAEMAVRKLREAREIYASIRCDMPDPKAVDRRIRRIDAVVNTLEERFQSIKSVQ